MRDNCTKSDPSTRADLAKIDYQSLPLRHEIGIFFYDSEFGEKVTRAYYKSMIHQAIREAKYGKEIAQEYRRGRTPSLERRIYCEAEEEWQRQAELSLTEDEGNVEDAELPGVKEDVSLCEEKANKVPDNLGRHIKISPLHSRGPPLDCGVSADDNFLTSNCGQLRMGGCARKRRRDEVKTPEDTARQAEMGGPNKKRKKDT